MAWNEWMVVSNTLEEELALERAVRAVEKIPDIETLQGLAMALTRQAWHQQKLIKQAVGHIAEMDAVYASLE
jgi:non-canonical (house-cleaning) NTP pyrophosphatase|tara:strand:- start:669 stop:884 length:216 start_codon:yes stop_codon:yes gene_type:complete